MKQKKPFNDAHLEIVTQQRDGFKLNLKNLITRGLVHHYHCKEILTRVTKSLQYLRLFFE